MSVLFFYSDTPILTQAGLMISVKRENIFLFGDLGGTENEMHFTVYLSAH